MGSKVALTSVSIWAKYLLKEELLDVVICSVLGEEPLDVVIYSVLDEEPLDAVEDELTDELEDKDEELYEDETFDFKEFFDNNKIAIFIIAGFLFLLLVIGGKKK